MARLFDILNVVSSTLKNGGGTYTSTLADPFKFTESTRTKLHDFETKEMRPYGARYSVALVGIGIYEVKHNGYCYDMTKSALNAFISKLKQLDPLARNSDNSLGAAIVLSKKYLKMINDKPNDPLSFGYSTSIDFGCLCLEAVAITAERDVALMLAALNDEEYIYDGYLGVNLRVKDYIRPDEVKRAYGAELE